MAPFFLVLNLLSSREIFCSTFYSGNKGVNMGMLSSDQDGELFAEINVTPMVDVMLVLLIIFMVTAPFMIETIGVNLPKGEGADAQGLSTPLTISIDKN